MNDTAASAELRRYLEAVPETRMIELLIPDMNGVLRGKRIGPDEFDKVFGGGVNFCASTVILDTKGATYTRVPYGGRDGDPDIKARAVAGSLATLPWARQPAAQALLELCELDGTPYFADPRQVLRRTLKALADLGLQPVVATELEFYLIEHSDGDFQPRLSRIPGSDLPQDGLQFATLDDLVDVDPMLGAVADWCEAQSIPAGAALSEFAPGQFEVNLHHVPDPVLACDHAVLLKRVVKAAARAHGLAASFMAKPFADYAGCGLHIHMSLLDRDGRNVFAGESADGPFSDTLRHAIGGLIAALPESMAVFAPNANSYRRFGPGTYTPLAPTWGTNHRHLALRIPLSAPENTRVEHRVAGADANPYLTMAAVLAGLHHGIAGKLDPGPMVATGEPVEQRVTLPDRWELALAAFGEGSILPEYFGSKYHQVYATCRREECDRFHAEITNRDFEWYLRAV